MARAKELLKWMIATTCSPRMQHKIRSFYLARGVVARRDFHEREMAVLKHVVQPGDSVADIGANVGAYTIEFAALVGGTGRVYAFEPVQANNDILQTVIRKAKLSNVVCFPLAVGAAVEEREIAIPDLGGFTGYYWARFARPGEGGEKVKVSTLDELSRSGELPRLDFIKCDVEGSELDVLRGGEAFLRSQHPAWLIEVSRETSGDVFALLRNCGYRAFVYDGDLVPTEGYRDKEYSNYFFFHPESNVWPRAQGVTRHVG